MYGRGVLTSLLLIAVFSLATIAGTPILRATAEPVAAVVQTTPGSPGAPPYTLTRATPTASIPGCTATPPPPPNPQFPTNVQASSPSGDNVTVITWTPPADATGI